jgi:hypothetical protein
MAEGGETMRACAWDDPFHLDGQRSEVEKLVRDEARAFAQGYLLPRSGLFFSEARCEKES